MNLLLRFKEKIYKLKPDKCNMNEIISSKIKGKWVIILDENIIASGDDIAKIVAEARAKYPGKKFVLAKVPEEGPMIY